MEHQTLVVPPSDPATQHIVLKIVGFFSLLLYLRLLKKGLHLQKMFFFLFFEVNNIFLYLQCAQPYINSVSKRKWQKFIQKLLIKSSRNNFIFLLVVYLLMCLMKATKIFENMRADFIVKTHSGKLALKCCIFRHETKIL